MNGRACSFVRTGAVRMCTVLVRGLDMGCVLPTGRGVRPELILELVSTFRVCTCRTVFGLDSASRSVSCMCMCVCTAVGMCSSTCILCTAFRMSARANVPSLPYPLRSSLGYHERCTYLPVSVLVLVPLLYSASLGRPEQCIICPCSYSYWTPCAVLRSVSTGNVPTCPCSYLSLV